MQKNAVWYVWKAINTNKLITSDLLHCFQYKILVFVKFSFIPVRYKKGANT